MMGKMQPGFFAKGSAKMSLPIQAIHHSPDSTVFAASLNRWRLALRLCIAISTACLSVVASAADEKRYGISVDSAELSILMGFHSRGVDLDLGRYGPADRAEAARWYRKAAVLGFPLAQYRLGRHYESGRGLPKDYVLAYFWYNLAAARGDDLAAEDRDVLAKSMTQEEIMEAQRLSRQLTPFLP